MSRRYVGHIDRCPDCGGWRWNRLCKTCTSLWTKPSIAYVCSEPGCEAVFTDPDPDEAWGQYVEHQGGHDVDNDYVTIAEGPD